MKKTLLLLAAMLLCSVGIKAADDPQLVDFGVMVLDTPYAFECSTHVMYHDVQGEFRAPEDMVLEAHYAEGGMDVLWPWPNPEHYIDEEHPAIEYSMSLDNTYMSIELKAGQTVYFYKQWVMAPFTVTLKKAGGDFDLEKTLPEAGKLLSMGDGDNYQSAFYFQTSVSVESASVSAAGKEIETEARVYDYMPRTVVVDIKYPIVKMLKEGTLQANDEVTVNVKGVRNLAGDLYNGDGVASVTYKVKKLPMYVVSETSGEGTPLWNDFYAYFQPSTKTGIVKIELSEEPVNPGYVSGDISIGDPTYPQNIYIENLKDIMTVEGKIITIDFRGKNRFIKNILPSVTDPTEEPYQYMSLKIGSLYGADGQKILTDDMGTEGTINHYWNFKDQPEPLASVDYTLVPTSVTPADMDEVEELKQIDFTFDCDMYIYPSMSRISLKGLSGQVYAGNLVMSDDHRTLSFVPDTPVTKEDTYSLQIIEGSVGNEAWMTSGYVTGAANARISTNVVVAKQWDPVKMDFTPLRTEPPEGLDLTMLRVTRVFFDEAVYYNYIWSTLSFTGPDGNEIPCTFEAKGEEYFHLEISFEEPKTEEGTYTLTIPEANFGNKLWRESDYISGRCNPEIVYSWEIKQSGIDTISADEVAADEAIFNLQGIRVANPTQPGIYIKGGKKIYIK